MADNRRGAKRLGFRLHLSYTIAGTKKLGTALTNDVSDIGARFVAEHPLPVGTRLELHVELPDRSQPIHILGEVVWSHPASSADRATPGAVSEVGVRFVAIAPKDRALLGQYARLYPEGPRQ